MTTGERIKQRREELKISQDKLAALLGYTSRSSISKIEADINDLTQTKLVAFAEALDTTPEYLMGLTDDVLSTSSIELIQGRDFMLRLKELRKERNMTQVELSNKIGVTQATLSGWESGKYEMDNATLIKLSEIFNVSIDYLLGRSKDVISVNKLKFLRTEKNLSMREVAKRLGMPYTTYVNYEKGYREPNSEVLIDIADFFNVSVDYLIGRNDSRVDGVLNQVNEIENSNKFKE